MLEVYIIRRSNSVTVLRVTYAFLWSKLVVCIHASYLCICMYDHFLWPARRYGQRG